MPQDNSTPPTLSDVASAAGVSLATASRALNGSGRTVQPAYRERVLVAATALGYTPNLSAQAVAKGGSSVVALIVRDISDPYFSSIASGVIRKSEAAGLIVTIAVTHGDPEQELLLVRTLRGQRPRALILAGSREVDEPTRPQLEAELATYTRTGGRVVLVSQNDMAFDTVEIDNDGGSAALANALVALGYRRFAILAGPNALVAARTRATAFSKAVTASGNAIVVAVHGEFTRDGGHRAMTSLMDRLDEIDLVFAVNDVMAIGALAALRDRGIAVPDRIALAGYDDIETARDVSPALTTVRVPLEDAGVAAMALALGDQRGLVTLGVSVEVRASTPPR